MSTSFENELIKTVAGLRANIGDAMQMLADAGAATHEVEPLLVRVQKLVDMLKSTREALGDHAQEIAGNAAFVQAHQALRKQCTELETAVENLRAINARLKKDVEDARTWAEKTVAEVAAQRVVSCVYCGHVYEAGTPTSQDDRLTEHIRVCPKHPMRDLEVQIKTAMEAMAEAGHHDVVIATTLVDRAKALADAYVRAYEGALNLGSKALLALSDADAAGKESIVRAYIGGQKAVAELYNPPWSDEWPTEEGSYWFYGAKGRGTEPALHYVRVHRTGNGALVYVSGFALYPSEGAAGKWKKILEPAPPT